MISLRPAAVRNAVSELVMINLCVSVGYSVMALGRGVVISVVVVAFCATLAKGVIRLVLFSISEHTPSRFVVFAPILHKCFIIQYGVEIIFFRLIANLAHKKW